MALTTTTQMVLDKRDLKTLIDSLDALVLEYDMLLAREFTGYTEDRFYALELKERVQAHLDKLEN